mgnify:CR=1 FL=1|jgi:hypothetical protein
MLIQCYECGREVSTLAPVCPHCGAPSIIDVESTPKSRGVGYTIKALLVQHKKTAWIAFGLLILTILVSGVLVKLFTGLLAVILLLLYLGFANKNRTERK